MGDSSLNIKYAPVWSKTLLSVTRNSLGVKVESLVQRP